MHIIALLAAVNIPPSDSLSAMTVYILSLRQGSLGFVECLETPTEDDRHPARLHRRDSSRLARPRRDIS